jgi:hypothetical protein
MSHSKRNLFLFLAWIGLVTLACNLTANEKPPTLVPNDTILGTPPPTVGIGRPPAGTPPGGTQIVQQQVDVDLFNLVNQVESDRMMVHIRSLESFYTRHINSWWNDPERGIGAAYNYLMEQFQQIRAQAPATFSVFPQIFEATFNDITTSQRNIIAVLNGTEPGAGTIVIGAHYDSRTDDLNSADGYAPAADDNGSGVAAVLELARILSKQPQRSTIMFVLFSAEEQGRLGSKAFVTDYIVGRNIDLIAMLNLDTIGSYNAPDGTINDYQIRLYCDEDNTNRSPNRQLARTIEFIASYHGVQLAVDVQPFRDRTGRYGDHFSFQERGYPAIRFIEALEDTPYREGRDFVDKVEPEYLRRSTQTILAVVRSLAGGLRPPQQVVIRDNATVDAQGKPEYYLVWNQVPDASGYVVLLRAPGGMLYYEYFPESRTQTNPWSGFGDLEAVAVAAIDGTGLIGPPSTETVINPPR